MAEMTAAEAIAWLTEDKAFGQECYSRKQIAQLIEQQQQQITDAMDALAMRGAEVARLSEKVEGLKCCGNCGNWEQFDEFGSEKIHNCIANKKLTWRERFDKCDKWEAADNG